MLSKLRPHLRRVGHKTRRMAQHEVEREYATLTGREDRLDHLLAAHPTLARLGRSRAQHALALANKSGITDPKWRPWIYVVTAPLDGADTMLPMRPASGGDFREAREGKLMGASLFDEPLRIDAGGYVIEQMAEPSARMVAGLLRLCRSGVFEFGWRFSRDDWTAIPASS